MLKQENKMYRDRIERQQKQDSLKKMKTTVFRFLDARKEKAFQIFAVIFEAIFAATPFIPSTAVIMKAFKLNPENLKLDKSRRRVKPKNFDALYPLVTRKEQEVYRLLQIQKFVFVQLRLFKAVK